MKKLKPIPRFKNEDEERDFWATHSTVDYFDFSKPLKIRFPNLKPSSMTITVRIPVSLYEDLKILANKKDVPYQSLLKIYLAEKVKEEFSRT